MKEMASKGNNRKKMLLIGLDKGGKTSIVLCLKGIRNIASFNLINPTIRINRENFRSYGSKLNIWDFGGQEQFRNDYLTNFKKYFLGTDKIIFVIDIQDPERYSIALNYLMEIVKKVQEEKSNIDFSIFLHKYDPDLEMTNKNFDENKADAFIEEIKRKMPANFQYEIAKTSIYTIFQKTNVL
jgi:GTPase SAR1 family protein